MKATGMPLAMYAVTISGNISEKNQPGYARPRGSLTLVYLAVTLLMLGCARCGQRTGYSSGLF